MSTQPDVVTVTLTLTAEQAAGLTRFTSKVTHSEAMSVLYAHKPREQREAQADEIMDAFRVLEAALGACGAREWPWINTGTSRP